MDYVFESQPPIIEQDKSMFARIVLVGAILGVVAWMLTYTLQRFVLANMVCNNGVVCVEAANYAGQIATVIIGVVGVIVLVRSSIYRPVLITLGAAISLWGLSSWLYGSGIVPSVTWTAILYALAYVAYAWVVRIRKVPVMLIVFVLLVIISRAVPAFV